MTASYNLSLLGSNYNQGGTGAVARTTASKLQESVSVKDFGAVGDGVTDDTAAIQAFFNASKNKRGFLNAGKYKINTSITLDTTQSYFIEGDGYDDNAVLASVIYNSGSSYGLYINGTGQVTDNLLKMENFAITGNALSDSGIYAIEVPGLRINNVLSANNGNGHGFRFRKCYNSSYIGLVATNNAFHGIFLDLQGNTIRFSSCISNANGTAGAYAGFSIVGGAGTENLGVTLSSCDATANPYGVVVQYTNSITITGCYSEGNTIANIYADSTAKNVTFTGNYQQDGVSQFVQCGNLVIEGNTFYKNTITTNLNITGPNNVSRTGLRIGRNQYLNGATKVFSNYAVEPNTNYGVGAPASGTYEVGDTVINSSPSIGLPIGWICTVAGAPGTWLNFGQLPAVYSDQGDTSVTLTYLASYPTNFWRSVLTADRTVTLSTTGATNGAKFRITRSASATGAFNLNVLAATGTKALAAGQWCDVEYSGSAWFLAAFGSL